MALTKSTLSRDMPPSIASWNAGGGDLGKGSKLRLAQLSGVSAQWPCISCMFFIMTASVLRNSSAGLKVTISVPGSCFTGTCPGGV